MVDLAILVQNEAHHRAHNDDKVQYVPTITQVRSRPIAAEAIHYHLHDQFQKEESRNSVVDVSYDTIVLSLRVRQRRLQSNQCTAKNYNKEYDTFEVLVNDDPR